MAGCGVHGPGALLERDVVTQHGPRVAVVQGVAEPQPFEFGALEPRDGLASAAYGVSDTAAPGQSQ